MLESTHRFHAANGTDHMERSWVGRRIKVLSFLIFLSMARDVHTKLTKKTPATERAKPMRENTFAHGTSRWGYDYWRGLPSAHRFCPNVNSGMHNTGSGGGKLQGNQDTQENPAYMCIVVEPLNSWTYLGCSSLEFGLCVSLLPRSFVSVNLWIKRMPH